MKTIYNTMEAPAYPYSFPHPKEETAFFDIETTGLSPGASSLYLIGFMYFDWAEGNWTLYQWFADNYQSEKEILETFLSHLAEIRYLYHFNGRTFDIPYILKKCTRHAISLSEHCRHLLNDPTGIYSIDLLGKIRPLRHALMLDKCNQTSIEHWLGIHRTDTFSGRDLITIYSEYMQQKIIAPDNAGKLEKLLLLHNHDDIGMMLNLCSLLTYDEYLSAACTERFLSEETLSSLDIVPNPDHTITILLTLPMAVPRPVHLVTPYPQPASTDTGSDPALRTMLRAAQLTLNGDKACFTFSIYKGTLKFFLPEYRDYYYLPKEDTAVHKSVAEFVDSAFRKKATASTCYIKKSGQFLPNLFTLTGKKCSVSPDNTASRATHLFFMQYRDKLSFCELPEDYTDNRTFWKQYLSMQLPNFRK